MDKKEKVHTIATGVANNLKTRSMEGGGEKPTEGTVESQTVEATTMDWPAMSKKAVEEIIRKFVERTKGEVSARYDMEPTNFLATPPITVVR